MGQGNPTTNNMELTMQMALLCLRAGGRGSNTLPFRGWRNIICASCVSPEACPPPKPLPPSSLGVQGPTRIVTQKQRASRPDLGARSVRFAICFFTSFNALEKSLTSWQPSTALTEETPLTACRIYDTARDPFLLSTEYGGTSVENDAPPAFAS